MNIFFLDVDPALAAQYHVDRHIPKMIRESSQLLSNSFWAHSEKAAEKRGLPYPTHLDHPCTRWVLESEKNYKWLYALFLCLLKESAHRFGELDEAARLLNPLRSNSFLRWTRYCTKVPLCMPTPYRSVHPINSYRRYYSVEKAHLASWTKRPVPTWFPCPQNRYAGLA